MRVMGDEQVARINADDYHRYDAARAPRSWDHAAPPGRQPPRHPHPAPVASAPGRVGAQARLRPPQRHPGRPQYRALAERSWWSRDCSTSTPRRCAPPTMSAYSWRPPEELRRAWKLKRDCTRRGYTTDEVLAELDRRERDADPVHPPPARARRHRRHLLAQPDVRPRAPRRRGAAVATPSPPRPLAAARRWRPGGPSLVRRERDLLLRDPRGHSTPNTPPSSRRRFGRG